MVSTENIYTENVMLQALREKCDASKSDAKAFRTIIEMELTTQMESRTIINKEEMETTNQGNKIRIHHGNGSSE